MLAYVGIVRAPKGSMLLGGVEAHKSAPFLDSADAEAWVEGIKAVNEGLGVKVGKASVKAVWAPKALRNLVSWNGW